MTYLKRTGILVGALVILLGAATLIFVSVINPAVMEEIRTNPTGEEASEAMLLTFESRTLPVNYLMEGNKVFMGVDGRWWRAFRGEGAKVAMLIQGKTYHGHGVVVLDDPEYVLDVFSRLRPTTPDWLPVWLNGKLVVITVED